MTKLMSVDSLPNQGVRKTHMVDEDSWLVLRQVPDEAKGLGMLN